MRGATDVHVLDEPDLGADRASEFEQIDQLVVIDAVDDDGIDLETGKERRGGGDAVENAIQLVVARQIAEALRMEGIEADGQPMQSGIAERASVRRQQHAIGRHREIADRRSRREASDEVWHVTTQQRFAAGQADLVHAKAREDIDQRLDLLEVQDVLARQPHVLRLRHAVAAAEIAAVGDREAEVPEGPVEAVFQHWDHYPVTQDSKLKTQTTTARDFA